MKTRAEAVEYIQQQLVRYRRVTLGGRDKHGKHHYGLEELRDLMDFIYESEPKDESETVKNWIKERLKNNL